jgi:hypothetical protein
MGEQIYNWISASRIAVSQTHLQIVFGVSLLSTMKVDQVCPSVQDSTNSHTVSLFHGPLSFVVRPEAPQDFRATGHAVEHWPLSVRP